MPTEQPDLPDDDGAPPVPAGYQPFEPAEDFGSDLVAEFERRGASMPPTDPAEFEKQVAAAMAEAEGATAEDTPEAAAETSAEPASQDAAAQPGEPAAGSTEPAAAADGELPPPEPGTEADQPPGGYAWDWVDESQQPQTQQFSDEQVQNALRVAADPRIPQGLALVEWGEQLTSAQREAMGQIGDGTHVALPRAEHDRYQAWLHQQQTAQRYPQLDEFEPEAAKIIREQQEQLAKLQGQQQPAGLDDNTPQASALAQGYSNAIAGIQQSWKLTDAEVDQLYAGARPFIGGLQSELSEFNPITGQLLRPADPGRVMHEAFSTAIARNPALHEQVLARAQQPQPTSPNDNPSPASVKPARDVAAKRANAASLASAPSAAVTPSPRSIRQMTNQELNDAMAAEIARYVNNGDGQVATT